MMPIQIIDLKQPDIRPNSESGENRYILNESYDFTLKIKGFDRTFRINRGFTYDGASVPRWAMFVIGFERDGVHRAASLVHDYLYGCNLTIRDNTGRWHVLTRKEVDKIFLLGMEHHGIKSVHGRLGYLTVRALGWLFTKG